MSNKIYKQTWNIGKHCIYGVLKDIVSDPDQIEEMTKDIFDILGIKQYDPNDPDNHIENWCNKDHFALYLLTHSSEDCAELMDYFYQHPNLWGDDKMDSNGVNECRRDWLKSTNINIFGHEDFFIDSVDRELLLEKL